MLPINSLSYFSQCELEESLLIRFAYRPEASMLDLVIRYAADEVERAFEAHRLGKPLTPVPVDFRHFRFEGIESLEAGNGSIVPATDWANYERLLIARPHVLTGVDHTSSDGRFVSSFFLDRFGIHRFAYASMRVEQRRADGIETEGQKWVYHDCSTGEIVSFSNPFPVIDA